MNQLMRTGLLVCLLAGLTGCDTPQERRREAQRERRLHERLDDIQAQLLAIEEKQAADSESAPAPTLRPVVPVRETATPAPTAPSDKQRIASLANRYNLKPVERAAPTPSRRTKSKSRSSSALSLRKKHVRVPVPVRTIQKALADANCSPGSIDGRIGPKTIAAIKAFQRKAGIKVDGVVGPVTWARLRQAGGGGNY